MAASGPSPSARLLALIGAAVVGVLVAATVVVVAVGDDDDPTSTDSAKVDPRDLLDERQLELIDQAEPSPSCSSRQVRKPDGPDLVALDVVRVDGDCLDAVTEYVPADQVEERQAELAEDPSVVAASVPPPATISPAEDDDRRDDQWALDELGAPEDPADSTWPDGSGIVVAVIDTGIDAEHPDLGDAVIARRHFPGEEGGDAAEDGHGTQTAGIIAARTGNGGIVGIAPAASILDVPVELGDHHGGTVNEGAGSWTIGLIWAVNHGADVVNMSFGGRWDGYTDEEREAAAAAVAYATDNDVVLVAAGGNCGNRDDDIKPCEIANAENAPALLDGVVAVAAVDDDLELAGYSTRNATIDLAAPGDLTVSTAPDGDYVDFDGTSAASPHVAAAAAVARASNPDAHAVEVAAALIESADLDRLDIDGDEEELGSGHGFLDINGTIERLQGISSDPSQTPLEGRTQAAYVQGGTLFAFDDGVAHPVRRIDPNAALYLDWSADHERLVGSDGNDVFVWSTTDRTLVEQRCKDCWGVAYVDSGFVLGLMDRIVTATYDGTLRTFDIDLNLRDEFPLAASDEDFTYYSVLGEVDGDVLVDRSEGPVTSLRLVDPFSGATTVAGQDTWGDLYPVATSAGGAQIAYAAVPANAGCFDVAKVYVVDGQSLQPVAKPPAPASLPTGGSVNVHDLFFNGDRLYAVVSTSRDDPANARCVETAAPTLWRLRDDGQWEQVHQRPIEAVRPLEGMSVEMTGQLALLPEGNGVFVPEGDSLDRSGDERSDLGTFDRSLWSTPTTEEVDLRVPGPISCPDISYAPNTDWGEFTIRAIGVTCEQAAEVIRTVNDDGPGWSEPGSYTTPDGYACSWTVNQVGLFSANQRCTRGLALITWVSS